MSELSGKTALVTGAGTGIGAEIALQLARQGAELVLVARTMERIEEVGERIREEGLRAHTLAGDIRSPELFEKMGKIEKPVDILVNNAAVFATYGPLEEVAPEEIQAVLDVDLVAALRLTQFVLPAMKSAGWGRIVHIGSVAGRLGAVGQVAYSTAKAGLEGLTRSVAAEVGRHGITCNLVEPGLVETARTLSKIDEQTRAYLTAATPLGRPGTPAEVAATVAFLASPRAAAITGAVIPVDGGVGLRSRQQVNP